MFYSLTSLFDCSGNKSFIPREGETVCVPCYEEHFAQRCLKCNGVINKGGITYKGTPYHRDCFTCTHCSKILAGEKFTSREEQPYCADCFGELFAKKCCKCSKPITGKTFFTIKSNIDSLYFSMQKVWVELSLSLLKRDIGIATALTVTNVAFLWLVEDF